MIGLNCATGPAEMSEHLRHLSQHARIPVSVMPNAGLPVLGKNGAEYPLTPDELAEALAGFVTEFGLSLVGGCCGTTNEHVRAVAEAVAGVQRAERDVSHEPAISSMYSATPFAQENSVLNIGERTNANGSKGFREAMIAEDYQKCLDIAKDQNRDGAHMLDLCVDYVGRDGTYDMSALAAGWPPPRRCRLCSTPPRPTSFARGSSTSAGGVRSTRSTTKTATGRSPGSPRPWPWSPSTVPRWWR